jgi:hypothetical protein
MWWVEVRDSHAVESLIQSDKLAIHSSPATHVEQPSCLARAQQADKLSGIIAPEAMMDGLNRALNDGFNPRHAKPSDSEMSNGFRAS